MVKTCLLCKKEYEIKPGHPQYRKLLIKKSSSFTCESCNRNLQMEASATIGLKPEDIETDHDRMLKK